MYVVPLGAALWSCPPRETLAFPAASYFAFFQNHGLLAQDHGRVWRHVRGGSQAYVRALLAKLRGFVRLGAPVVAVRRTESGVTVETAGAPVETFDQVVIAIHADQALAILIDADATERAFLGSVPKPCL